MGVISAREAHGGFRASLLSYAVDGTTNCPPPPLRRRRRRRHRRRRRRRRLPRLLPPSTGCLSDPPSFTADLSIKGH